MHHNLNNMMRDAVLASDSVVGVSDTISVFFFLKVIFYEREWSQKA
jgi:hypothetical protein